MHSEMLIDARRLYPSLTFYHLSDLQQIPVANFDYIIVSIDFSSLQDIQDFLCYTKQFTDINTSIVFIYQSTILSLFGNLLGSNNEKRFFLSSQSVRHFLYLEDFIVTKHESSTILCTTVARVRYESSSVTSISIIVPARNESGNIQALVKRLPDLGCPTEVLFVEGGSTDNTFEEIERVITSYQGSISLRCLKQSGKGKHDAVALGFSEAKNDLLMILDADLSVAPEDLPKFYKAYISGKGDVINGSRMIYPIAPYSMQSLNKLANKVFAIIFSFLLKQRVKDTLCGTKVISKANWIKITNTNQYRYNKDPFGDFSFLFGAADLKLKITDVPIRYKARTYGKTNINRFPHGFILLKILLEYILTKSEN
jgi:hypothetical protein